MGDIVPKQCTWQLRAGNIMGLAQGHDKSLARTGFEAGSLGILFHLHRQQTTSVAFSGQFKEAQKSCP